MKKLLVGALLLTGCATTHIANSWKNPDFKQTIQFQKVVVMAVAKNETTRRVAEDELVKAARSGKAIASYKLLPSTDLADTEAVKAALKEKGADGLVIVREIDTRKEENYVPGSVVGVYQSPWTYSSMAAVAVREPGYFETATVLRLETNIYSLADEKLIWSGTSETYDPQDVQTEAKNLAQAVRQTLKKEGLIK